jgi:hypothetical protein
MKIKILFDVSGTGYFPVGSEVDAAVSPRGDMAVAFNNDQTASSSWSFCTGQFAVVPDAPAAAARGSLSDVIGHKPARINIEF